MAGRAKSFGKMRNGDEISLFFDAQTKLPVGFETIDTEALDGDVPAQYLFDDYKAVDGVQLPHKITIKITTMTTRSFRPTRRCVPRLSSRC